MTKERRSKTDKLRRKNEELFVGREEPIQRFRRHLESKPDDDDFLDIYNIYGQGGVGKSYLCQKLLGMAKAKNALTTYTDEGVKSVVEWMGAVAKQLTEQEAPLKAFSERYERYLQEQKKLEADPEAPKGWLPFITRSIVKGGLAAAKGIPGAGGFIELIDRDAAGDQASELASYLHKKLKNKDEVKLVLEPVEVLTSLFLDGLYEYEEKLHLCFFIDTYEETSRFLDHWLRDLLAEKYGEVPSNMAWVIAGRERLDGNAWSPFSPIIEYCSLEPFTDKEAKQFLNTRGIKDQSIRDAILKVALNLPVYLAMLADDAPNEPEAIPDFAETIIDRFLQWIEDPVQRKLALEASLPRQLNKDIIKRLLPPTADSDNYFRWLCDRPFVENRGGTWTYHPTIRELMVKHLRQRSYEDWEMLNTQIAWYYEERANSLGIEKRGDQFQDPNWQKYTLEYNYHQLLINPQRSMPEAIRGFGTTFRIKKANGARSWAEAIFQVEKIWQSSKWGEILQVGLDQVIADDVGCTSMMEALTREGWILDKEDLHFLYYNTGLFLFGSHQYEKAIQGFEVALEVNPNSFDSWYFLGLIYSTESNLEKALKCHENALQINSNLEMVWRSMGTIYSIKGEYDESVKCYKEALKIKEDDPWTLICYGNAWMEKMSYDNAYNCYKKALEIDETIHYGWVQFGYYFFESGNDEECFRCLAKAIELSPKDTWVIFSFGNIYFTKNDFKKAENYFDQAIKIDPNHALSWEKKGEIYLKAKEYDKAILHFDKAISMNQNYSEPYHYKGVALMAKGNILKAIKNFEKAVELNPNNHRPWNHLYDIYRKRGDFEKAINCYNGALKNSVEPFILWHYMGRDFLGEKNYENAALCFEESINLNPQFIDALDGLGKSYILIGNYSKANDCYEKWKIISPEDADLWHSIGWMFLYLFQLEQSTYHLKKAWDLSENRHKDAAMNIGHILLYRSRKNEALSWFGKSLALSWDENFFEWDMNSDYTDLKMADHGISREAYDDILQTLREEAKKLIK